MDIGLHRVPKNKYLLKRYNANDKIQKLKVTQIPIRCLKIRTGKCDQQIDVLIFALVPV